MSFTCVICGTGLSLAMAEPTGADFRCRVGCRTRAKQQLVDRIAMGVVPTAYAIACDALGAGHTFAFVVFAVGAITTGLAAIAAHRRYRRLEELPVARVT